MTIQNSFLAFLGAVLVITCLIAVIGLVAETPGHLIPREHVCVAPALHSQNFTTIWDTVVRKTGIEEETASLTRITLDIDPDDSVETMDLRFIAKKDGVEGYYSVWYRRNSSGCGWIDGLIYPGIFPDLEPENTLNPRSILEEIQEIPSSSMDLSQKKVRILGDCTQNQQDFTRDAARVRKNYIWTNRSLVHLLPAQPDYQAGSLFGLDYSQITCTPRREGLINCPSERWARVFSTTPAGPYRCIPHGSR
jgi:hypothetical protein